MALFWNGRKSTLAIADYPERYNVEFISTSSTWLRFEPTLDLTQEAFSAQFGFSKGAVRDWEQGRKVPEASARILLKVIEQRPDVVLEVLDAA